jgi:hypothetical protein
MRYLATFVILSAATLSMVAGERVGIRTDEATIAESATPAYVFPKIAADQSRRPTGISSDLVDDPWIDDGYGATDICATGTAHGDMKCTTDGSLYTCTSATNRICKVVNAGTARERCKTCFN